MIAERPPSQRQRVFALLRDHPEGICLEDVPLDLAYTLRNRISELSAAGYPIISRRCTWHRHRSVVRRYSLTGVVENPELPL